MAADIHEITMKTVPMRQWRITGSDGEVAIVVTAYYGESIEYSAMDPYRQSLTAALAHKLGDALEEAATFVETMGA